MNRKHYRSSNSELPTRNGIYGCRFYWGKDDARWNDGTWYYMNWKNIPVNIEVEWRHKN